MLNGFKLQDSQLLKGHPVAQIEDLYSHDPSLSIEIENDTWLYLFGFDNG